MNIPLLDIAGLDTEQNTQRMFVRKDWAEYWTTLMSNKSVFLTGPPGTGKSSLVWAWSLYQAHNKVALRWIHLTPFTFYAVDFSNGSYYSWNSDIADLSTALSNCDASVLVVDGITHDRTLPIGKAESWWLDSKQNRKLIYVSSLQFVWGQEHYDRLKMEKLVLPGWEEEDYLTACQQDAEFLKAVTPMLDTRISNDVKVLISAKVTIAGACARWMFGMNTDKARQDILRFIRKAGNAEQLIAGLCGTSSEQAVNHLITTTRDEHPSFVSLFVAREIGKKCDSKFVLYATQMSPRIRNGSMDGWIFQMDFLNRVTMYAANKEKLRLFSSLPDGTMAAEEWPVAPHVFEFYHEDEIAEQIHVLWKYQQQSGQQKVIPSNTWLIPTKVNQGCYDMLCLVFSAPAKGFILRVVQLTVAPTHDLKLSYVGDVLDVLKKLLIPLVGLDVAFVVPKTVFSNFKQGKKHDADDARLTDKSLNWDASKVRTLLFQRANEP